MKNLIIALLLLATTPAFAVNRTAPPSVLPTIYALHKAYSLCYRTDRATHPVEYFLKACADDVRLQKKLEAQGFCVRGHVFVGQYSGDRKHCYKLNYSVP